VPAGARSLRLDIGELDHPGPLLGLIGDELAKIGRRPREQRAANVGETRSYLWIAETRIDLVVELADNFVGVSSARRRLNFNFIRDIAPVASISRNPIVLEVNSLVAAKSVPKFITYAKANPGKVNFASASNGSAFHLAGELFKMMADIEMVHVPYRGSGPVLTDLIGGRVQAMFDNVTTSLEHIRSGKLRALAVTTAARSEVLPEIPTVGEFLQGYEASARPSRHCGKRSYLRDEVARWSDVAF
jgi:tripartite-type tricarboxylate transporter receptor subunit TctC